MTQYPEVALAREKSLCYLGIGIITDYDVGLEGEEGILPVSADEIISVFGKNVSKAKSLISEILPKLSSERKCKCKDSLEGAFISH
jgi:Purine nucleoside phosphorylase